MLRLHRETSRLAFVASTAMGYGYSRSRGDVSEGARAFD